MTTRVNLQYLLSYLGLIPFFYLILKKYYFFQINESTSKTFILYYTLIIFVFIGATNWNLNKKIDNLLVFYGFLPSILAVSIIYLNLSKINENYLLLFLILFLLIQLLCDYLFIYLKKTDGLAFFILRFPLTILISISIIIIIN